MNASSHIYKKVFVGALVICLCLPSLYFLGLKEKTFSYGSETITELPSLQTSSFKKRKFQGEFEQWWNSHFAFRKRMLKTKNQLYDWLNFGLIHAGYSENIIEGAHQCLFGKYLFASVAKPCPNIPAFDRLEQFYRQAKAKGIAVYFILAPSKALTYYDYLPARYKYFLSNQCPVNEQLAQAISALGIRVYDAQPLIERLRATHTIEPFPMGGIHWNFWGAGNVLKDSAQHFKWGRIDITDVEKSDTPYFTEQDLTLLQNLLRKRKIDKVFYKPMLKPYFKWKGRTVIMGDSYSNEYVKMLLEAGIVHQEQLAHYENTPLTDEDATHIWSTKRIILIYSDAIVDPNHQFYQKIDKLLTTLKGE